MKKAFFFLVSLFGFVPTLKAQEGDGIPPTEILHHVNQRTLVTFYTTLNTYKPNL